MKVGCDGAMSEEVVKPERGGTSNVGPLSWSTGEADTEGGLRHAPVSLAGRDVRPSPIASNPHMKRCYSCATVRLPADADECHVCGGHAFFFGKRLSRLLWPDLPNGGKDTIDLDGEEFIGEWDRQVSKNPAPRWRRKEA